MFAATSLAPRMDDDTITERLIAMLAEGIGIAAQAQLGETPVPFADWPTSHKFKALYAARVAARWNDDRARRDAELHCRVVLALQRHELPYARLSASQQNRINRDVAAVLTVFAARMSDLNFLYLGQDQRTLLQPERQTVAGRIQ